MKTLADFKRKLAVGVKVQTTFHQESEGRDKNGQIILTDKDKGIREISIVQSNSFAFKTIHTDGKVVDSWMTYPKVKECEFINENIIRILSNDFRPNSKHNSLIPLLTLTFV